MSRMAVLLLVALAACTWLLAQPQPAQNAGPPATAGKKPNYQITAIGHRGILIDSVTGEQWQMVSVPGTDRVAWVPLKEPARDEAEKKKIRDTFDELAKTFGPSSGTPGRYQYISHPTGDKLFDTATGRLYIRNKKGREELDTWSQVIKGAD